MEMCRYMLKTYCIFGLRYFICMADLYRKLKDFYKNI